MSTDARRTMQSVARPMRSPPDDRFTAEREPILRDTTCR
jgi:hypothetical protein